MFIVEVFIRGGVVFRGYVVIFGCLVEYVFGFLCVEVGNVG